jgi:hypothetical protein
VGSKKTRSNDQQTDLGKLEGSVSDRGMLSILRPSENKLMKELSWTLKIDIVFPFLEIILFISLYIMLVKNALIGSAAVYSLENVTIDLIYLIILLVGIAGVRGYAIALERGEISRQMIGLRISRCKVLALKWLSIFIISFIPLLVVDIAVFIAFVGYFPSINSYSDWGNAPVLAFFLMIGEQALLIAFLNSLSAALSFGIKRTTVSLLIFFLIAFLGSQFYLVGQTGVFGYLQLGWGDWNILVDTYQYLNQLIFVHTLSSNQFNLEFYIGLLYRALGAVVLFLGSVLTFARADLD